MFSSIKITHEHCQVSYLSQFLFQNGKSYRILRKSVQTIVICGCSPTNTAVSQHVDARIPLEPLLCHLPKSFVFNRCHHQNCLSTNEPHVGPGYLLSPFFPLCPMSIHFHIFMVALCNRADHHIFDLWCLSVFFFISYGRPMV